MDSECLPIIDQRLNLCVFLFQFDAEKGKYGLKAGDIRYLADRRSDKALLLLAQGYECYINTCPHSEYHFNTNIQPLAKKLVQDLVNPVKDYSSDLGLDKSEWTQLEENTQKLILLGKEFRRCVSPTALISFIEV